MRPVLEAQSVSYQVGPSVLVRTASLAIASGKVTLIIGPNGAGKSTLMRLMSGELVASSGQVLSFGEQIQTIPVWKLACRRAMMVQSSRLAFPFTVYDVVQLGMDGLGLARSPSETMNMVRDCLEMVDMLRFVHRDFQTLSGGEQQRVQFARILCQLRAGEGLEPKQALLLDEPIASLDLCHQLALLDIARDLARHKGVAVLGILHDLNLAATYADQLVVMQKGRLLLRESQTRP